MQTENKSCETCLYMATHEKCDGCLHTKEDYELFRNGSEWPPFRYLNYKDGNWLGRSMLYELTGKQNIVIGGTGEAEVNTKQKPFEVSKHLHYVAEQCGYIVGTLHKSRISEVDILSLKISTSEGNFRLIWHDNQLDRIERLDRQGNIIDSFWDRQNIRDTLQVFDNSTDPLVSNYNEGLTGKDLLCQHK